jgi:isopenicillin N synthase-like dioxygenase
MAYARARRVKADEIPVIDVTPLRDGSDPRSVARALHAASQGLGFIYIAGHGIPEQSIESARAAALAFFRATPAAKDTVRVSARHRGWIARGGAKMQDDAKADLKESFVWGYQDAQGAVPDDHPLRGPNLWPGFAPELEGHAMRFFHQAHEVARLMMRGFALGLDLPEDFFLRSADRPLSRASFVYYPAQPEDLGSRQFGVGPHTDFGVLTVLCQDSLGGLQVKTAEGEWIHAPPIAGTLVINVADLLARWTDGAYTSTPHRVVNTSERERLSLVLAFDPNPETVIDPREIHGAGYQAREQPTTCGDYLTWRFGKAFAYRRS